MAILDDIFPPLFCSGFPINQHYLFSLKLLKTLRLTCHARRVFTERSPNIDSDSIKAVGSYKPNAFGLYDMHGNAWEWCEDWFGSLQYGDIKDPMGPIMGERRVLRGGSFGYGVSQARSSYRLSNSPFDRYILHPGFRLARTP
jgi:formylglycine-generating enzyme required for sulfatase activity